MKKVLFITFYWPPSGKASMHWPLKMIKYLPQYGWQPSVLTVKEDTFSEEDNSFDEDLPQNLQVVRTRFWDPFILYKKLLGKAPTDKLVASEALTKTDKSLVQRFTVWIRMNLFIPDARIGWYLPGVAAARKILRKEKYDAILTNGPPHTAHLLGKKLSREFSIPLVPVFIDPWVDISYYKNQKRNYLTLKLDNYLEKSVVLSASKLVFVTNGLIKYFTQKYPSTIGKENLLYWGYNEEDFENSNCSLPESNEEQVILHAGNIFDYQNPKNFWSTIKRQIESGKKLKLKFVGTVGPKIKSEIKENGLERFTEYLGFLPYKEVIIEMCKADYLLVCATEPRHLPGKLFEYMRTGNTIIAFGDDNDEVKEILQKTNSGILFNYEDSAEEIFAEKIPLNTNLEEVKKFDRKIIAEKLAVILNNL